MKSTAARNDLSSLEVGKSAIIHSVLPHKLAVKMTEMGVLPGKQVTVLYKAPLGDPIAVDIGGYVLSLRKEEARIVSLVD